MSQHQHPKHCLRQQSDQMTCTLCGKVWDMNDPEPPQCVDARTATGLRWLSHIRETLERGNGK